MVWARVGIVTFPLAYEADYHVWTAAVQRVPVRIWADARIHRFRDLFIPKTGRSDARSQLLLVAPGAERGWAVVDRICITARGHACAYARDSVHCAGSRRLSTQYGIERHFAEIYGSVLQPRFASSERK